MGEKVETESIAPHIVLSDSERAPRVTRFIALIVGLSAAAVALYTLSLSSGDSPVVTGPPLDEIDDASRAQLDRVLREAEQKTLPRTVRAPGDD